MSWQVALVLDAETNLNVAIGQMPIWAQATPEREAYPLEWREQWNAMWSPDPGFTLITTPPADDLVAQAAMMLPTIEMHHPKLFCVHLFGLSTSGRLDAVMAELGYHPATVSMDTARTFVRPFEQSARDLILDASSWSLRSDWYSLRIFITHSFSQSAPPNGTGEISTPLMTALQAGVSMRLRFRTES